MTKQETFNCIYECIEDDEPISEAHLKLAAFHGIRIEAVRTVVAASLEEDDFDESE